jgi:hypothetical protein
MAEITRRAFLTGLTALAWPVLSPGKRRRGFGLAPFGTSPFGR